MKIHSVGEGNNTFIIKDCTFVTHRHLGIITVTGSAFERILKGLLPVDDVVPQSAKLLSMRHNHETDEIYFTFEDDSYPITPEGGAISIECMVRSDEVLKR